VCRTLYLACIIYHEGPERLPMTSIKPKRSPAAGAALVFHVTICECKGAMGPRYHQPVHICKTMLDLFQDDRTKVKGTLTW
jgi:hypothetical protein